MFFVTYLRRELGRRVRQGIFVALGLALGVGLVITVAAASAGVNKAQSGVLSALYGVGTDVTVTGGTPGTPAGQAQRDDDGLAHAAAQLPPQVRDKEHRRLLNGQAGHRVVRLPGTLPAVVPNARSQPRHHCDPAVTGDLASCEL